MHAISSLLLIALASLTCLGQRTGRYSSIDSVQFSTVKFTEIKPANDSVLIFTTVKNLSGNDITIQVEPQATLRIQPRTHFLKAMEEVQIYIKVCIPEGSFDEQIVLKSKEWVFPLEFKGFGYALSTADFESTDQLQIDNSFYYFRTGNEFQMEIQKTNSKGKTKGHPRTNYIPLSKRLVPVTLNSGSYLVTIVGPNGRKSKALTLE